jgi:hypothetical protein
MFTLRHTPHISAFTQLHAAIFTILLFLKHLTVFTFYHLTVFTILLFLRNVKQKVKEQGTQTR